MTIGMSIQLRQAMQLSGGVTTSVFPVVERWLNSNSDYMFALEKLSARKNMDKYESIMDFVFCEVYGYYKKYCFAFYEHKTDGTLINMSTVQQRTEWQRVLLRFLNIAYQHHYEERALSWESCRKMALLKSA